MITRRRSKIVLLGLGGLSLAIAACGSDPLAELGERSNQFLEQARPAAVTLPPSSPEAPPTSKVDSDAQLRDTVEVRWLNEDDPIWGASGLADLEAAQILDVIWARSSGIDRFVQASPREIAFALPGIAFPSLVPASVGHISSQLVFGPPTGQPVDDFVAAFGLWAVRPYTQSRSAGQRAVLWVARNGAQVLEAEAASEPPTTRSPFGDCPDFGLSDARSCRPVPIGPSIGWWHDVTDGGRLIWQVDAYRYELFHRSSVPEASAIRMAESMRPLAGLVGGS